MTEGFVKMDTDDRENVGTGHQVYPREPPEIKPPKVNTNKYHVLLLSTRDEADIEIAKNRFKILRQKNFEVNHMSHDHTQPSEAVTEDYKNNLIRALFESKKVLMIVSKHFTESAYLGVQLNFIEELSHQRKLPLLIVYKVPNMSKLPRRLRSGTSLVTIPKDKYNTKKAITHGQEDADMEMLNAINDPGTKGFQLQNVAPGLVCGYFHNYLQFKLPKLALAITEEFKTSSSWNVQVPEKNVFKKMIILLPESCTIPSSFSDLNDSSIGYVVNSSHPDEPHVKAKVTKDQGGQLDRDYSSSLCSVKGSVLTSVGLEDITYVCAVEFASPLSNLNTMRQESDLYDGFSQEDKEREYNTFVDHLSQVLDVFPDCRDKCILLDYNDDSTEQLSKKIIDAIQEDIIRQENIDMVVDYPAINLH